jgi:hypothetical protein
MQRLFTHKKVYDNLRGIALNLSNEFSEYQLNENELVNSFLRYINYQNHRNINTWKNQNIMK